MSGEETKAYLETEEDPVQLMARLIRRQGLPVAAQWSEADSYATLYIGAGGEVHSSSYAGEQGAYLEELSPLGIAHLWQHGVRGAEAEEFLSNIRAEMNWADNYR